MSHIIKQTWSQSNPGFSAALFALFHYERKYPKNWISLGAFTLSTSLCAALPCAVVDGKIVLQALALTTSAVSSLTAYTFWAAEKGQDFSHLKLILFPSLFTITVAGFIELFFPFGSPLSGLLAAMGAITFSGLIVYDTDSLLRRYRQDEYMTASVALYLDVLNLYLEIMKIITMLMGQKR